MPIPYSLLIMLDQAPAPSLPIPDLAGVVTLYSASWGCFRFGAFINQSPRYCTILYHATLVLYRTVPEAVLLQVFGNRLSRKTQDEIIRRNVIHLPHHKLSVCNTV